MCNALITSFKCCLNRIGLSLSFEMTPGFLRKPMTGCGRMGPASACII